jgi:phenylacetic acid degradation operon negative regulatory protein
VTAAGSGALGSVGQPSARSLILDIYGAEIRALGGWLAIAALVALMADLGHDAQAVRAAVSRMKASALLTADTRDGVAGYGLTESALEILRDGDERLFHASAPPGLDDGWVVAVFSVPEQSRERRHRLRALLIRLGFGQVTPGAWMAPSRMEREARRLLDRAQLAQYVSLFEGDYRGCAEIGAVAARAWDMGAIDRQYRGFIARHRRTARAWRARQRDNRRAFIDYMEVLAAWRPVAYLDPGLPGELLPARWSGGTARGLFAELHATLATRAGAHVEAIVSEARAEEA